MPQRAMTLRQPHQQFQPILLAVRRPYPEGLDPPQPNRAAHMSSQTRKVWEHLVGIIMICLTVVSTLSAGTWYLVRRHPDRCHQLHSVLLCRGLIKNDFPSTMYSRVDNSETSSLLLNPSNVMSDSDDDMLI
uniref:Uncharacterized protein n=1 Tax=Anopheles melas TaxID=34690 RepID=A0A182TFV2_9DIPT